MKSIAAAGAVLALATTGTVVVQTQAAPAAVAQEAGATKGPIESPSDGTQKDTISGDVQVVTNNQNIINGNGNRPIEGVRIYAQWFDDKGKVASPVYTTTSDATGKWGIKMLPFNAAGKKHTFDADPNLPEGEKFRVWSDNPDPKKYGLFYSWGQEGVWPPTNTYLVEAGTNYGLGPNTIQPVKIRYQERPQNEVMHLDKAEDTSTVKPYVETVPNRVKGSAGGQVVGRAFWNLTATPTTDWTQHNMYDGGDSAAPGLKVTGSYLSDYAVQKINNDFKPQSGRKVRGSGWTTADEEELQKWIKDQMAAEGKDKWIAETVTATTAADGTYALQFKGTYGDSALSKSTFNDANLWHQVAESPAAGTWLNLQKQSKHINTAWTFVSIEQPKNASATGRWQFNNFDGIGASGQIGSWQGAAQGLENINGALGGDNIDMAHFILQAESFEFDVVKYDTDKNPAGPGTKVETFTGSLPFDYNAPFSYNIEWFKTNDAGELEKVEGAECKGLKADGKGELKSCPITVPTDLAKDTIYVAKLTEVSPAGKTRLLGQDSFLAKVDKTKQKDEFEPGYEDGNGKPGEDVKVPAPSFKDKDGKDTKAPEGTKFEKGEGAP
ncbi:YPDG domain-containing protein, partial [Corynebacterium macclintockiae]